MQVKLLGKREEKKQQQLAVTCQKMCDILFNRLLAHESARAAADKTSPKYAFNFAPVDACAL